MGPDVAVEEINRELEPLVQRCRQGDALAWESLVRRTQRRVYAMALHYLRSPEEARDLAQDVFVKVYGKLDRFQGGDFMPWLLRLTRNACIDHVRRRKARPPVEDWVVDGASPLADERQDPAADQERSDRVRLVHRAMDRLSAINREVVFMHDIEGLELAQIAEVLGVPVGTVKSRSNRARIELAKAILAIDPAYRPAEGAAR